MQNRIARLLERPVGRLANEVRRSHVTVRYQAGSWAREFFPRVGFIVTNVTHSANSIVRFYKLRGTEVQWIKEGKGAIRWTRLSRYSFNANAVRLQLHALAYNLGNFSRALATPEAIKSWSFANPREKLIKIDAKVVSQGRYVAFGDA